MPASQRAKVTAGSRILSAFSNQPIVVEGLALITPANATPSTGTRWQYEYTSIDFIDSIWPIEATTERPVNGISLLDAQTLILAATPDQAYRRKRPARSGRRRSAIPIHRPTYRSTTPRSSRPLA